MQIYQHRYKESVDLIITSPPYFSVERYSYDDTQSWVRHKNIDRWKRLTSSQSIK